MGIQILVQKVGEAFRFRKKNREVVSPLLTHAARFPYGPFRFKIRLAKEMAYSIMASSDLKHWNKIADGVALSEEIEYVDSDATKFGFRFYRVLGINLPSVN